MWLVICWIDFTYLFNLQELCQIQVYVSKRKRRIQGKLKETPTSKFYLTLVVCCINIIPWWCLLQFMVALLCFPLCSHCLIFLRIITLISKAGSYNTDNKLAEMEHPLCVTISNWWFKKEFKICFEAKCTLKYKIIG